MSDTVYTLILNPDQEEQLFQAWSDTQAKTPQYAKWQLHPENCVITCYTSGKTVFQGKDALVYASPFLDKTNEIKKKTESSRKLKAEERKDILPQAGSDEVGTGDYFGPVVVCAAIVTEKTIDPLRKLGVRDSKQLRDEEIRKIGPRVMALLPHSLLIVPPEKYNAVHETHNMNAIKALLHNQAYVNLEKQCGLPSFRIIDQFTPENLFYRYVSKADKIIQPIHFETKAEDKYPAVGAASVIARYVFLKQMEEMEKQWQMTFHKGAGSDVDQCARHFVETYGKENLGKVAKLHFKNTEKL